MNECTRLRRIELFFCTFALCKCKCCLRRYLDFSSAKRQRRNGSRRLIIIVLHVSNYKIISNSLLCLFIHNFLRHRIKFRRDYLFVHDSIDWSSVSRRQLKWFSSSLQHICISVFKMVNLISCN